MFGHDFPYLDTRDINLDWLLKNMKTLVQDWTTYQLSMNQQFSNLTEAFNALKAWVESYFENLDVSAEIEQKIDRMAVSGELGFIMRPIISGEVTDWLAEHITQPTEPAIDNSLTVAGAAADSKAAGDAIRKLQRDTAYSIIDSYAIGSLISSQLLPDNINSHGVLSGTVTTDAAWRVNGSPTSGANYCYTTYTIPSSYRKQYVTVSGHSWGEQYPLLVFYDSSDNILGIYGALTSANYNSELIFVPDNTAYAVVNGDQRSGGILPVMSTYWTRANIIDGIFSQLRAFNTVIEASYISDHASYSNISNWANNYIYAVGSTAYTAVTGFPQDFTSYGTLIKFTPRDNRSNRVYSAYILANNRNVWIGYETGDGLTWHSVTINSIDANRVKMSTEYLVPTAETPGKAISLSGTEGTSINYQYNTYTVTPGDHILITGWHFYSASFPLYIFYDADNVIVDSTHITDGQGLRALPVTVPKNAVKLDVNGQKNTNGNFFLPTVERYTGDVTGADVYEKAKKRRYLFIGDSYCEGYTHDGDNSGWAVYAAGFMGLTSDDYVRLYQGGASFSANGADNTYTALLLSEYYPYNYFTDIVVCGGYNDNGNTDTEITTGISGFIAKAKKIYPFARIHIGFIAWNKQGDGSGAEENWETIQTALAGTVLPAYQKCIRNGAEYLSNVEYWLNADGLSHSDGYHPAEAGNQNIGMAVANALLTGSAPLPYNRDLRL